MSKVTRELRDDKGRLLGTVTSEPVDGEAIDAPHGGLVVPDDPVDALETLAELGVVCAHFVLQAYDESSPAARQARSLLGFVLTECAAALAAAAREQVDPCPTCGTTNPESSPTHVACRHAG